MVSILRRQFEELTKENEKLKDAMATHSKIVSNNTDNNAEEMLTKLKKDGDFRRELTQLINRYSIDNSYNTPDYILSDYLIKCMRTYKETIVERDRHLKTM